MSADPAALLATVAQAQQQLAQLEATAKGLIDELAASGGAGATPRLRDLLATGQRLVASVAQAGQQLGSALPPAPSAEAVEAVWAHHAQRESGAPLLPTRVPRPAPSLAELQDSLAFLPGCRLQLLQGRQPVDVPARATTLVLRCGRALAAVVHLQQTGGLLPLRVGVLSAAEADAATSSSSSGGVSSSSGSGASLWAPSQHAVFRHLSAQAAAALQHFLAQRQQAGSAAGASPLEMLLLWLATCSDVFTRPSSTSGSLLLADPAAAGGGLLPPLQRPWQLSWEQLWQAAVNPRLRQAEHVGAGEG